MCARTEDDALCLSIADNGTEGADSRRGSGLVGHDYGGSGLVAAASAT